MKQLTKKMTGLTAAFAYIATALFVAPSASAQSPAQEGANVAQGEGTPGNLFNGDGSIFTTIVNLLLFIIGAVSVVMLIWGGIRYTTSGGNASSVTAAKNTIMYAIIGLIVAFLAFAIVNWVLEALLA